MTYTIEATEVLAEVCEEYATLYTTLAAARAARIRFESYLSAVERDKLATTIREAEFVLNDIGQVRGGLLRRFVQSP
jgi:hypothetical protein